MFEFSFLGELFFYCTFCNLVPPAVGLSLVWFVTISTIWPRRKHSLRQHSECETFQRRGRARRRTLTKFGGKGKRPPSPPSMSVGPSVPQRLSLCSLCCVALVSASVSLFCWLGDATLLPAALLTGECTSFILIFILLLPPSPSTSHSPITPPLLSYVFHSFLFLLVHSFVPHQPCLPPLNTVPMWCLEGISWVGLKD